MLRHISITWHPGGQDMATARRDIVALAAPTELVEAAWHFSDGTPVPPYTPVDRATVRAMGLVPNPAVAPRAIANEP